MTQADALSILKLGKNVFLTGAPGAGKTYLLNQYIAFLRGNGVSVAVTAYTGIAASHINGRTLHSWAGLPRTPMQDEKEERKRVRANQHVMARVQRARVLIIDEISMLHPEEFDRLDVICRAARFSEEPFGGLQIICCGDFFQIPPVRQLDGRFVIDCNAWKSAEMAVCYLHEQHRQGDVALLGILSEIRGGAVSAENIALLNARLSAKIASTVGVARLETHRNDVHEVNSEELNKLQGDLFNYEVHQSGDARDVEKTKKEYEIGPLALKVGAHVMFTRNNPGSGYVNGTLGKIVDFQNIEGEACPVVETFDGRRIIATRERWEIVESGSTVSIRQIPLKLAWAITIHKSQGMTLDAAIINLGRAFERGMGYVALSRVRRLEHISLLGFNEMALLVSERVKLLDRGFLAASAAGEDRLRADLAAPGGEEAIKKQQETFLSEAKKSFDPNAARDPNALRIEYSEEGYENSHADF